MNGRKILGGIILISISAAILGTIVIITGLWPALVIFAFTILMAGLIHLGVYLTFS